MRERRASCSNRIAHPPPGPRRFRALALQPASRHPPNLRAIPSRLAALPTAFYSSSRGAQRRGDPVALGGPTPRLAASHGPRSVPCHGPWGARTMRSGGPAGAPPTLPPATAPRTPTLAGGKLPLARPASRLLRERPDSAARRGAPRHSPRRRRWRLPTAIGASGDPLAPQRWAAHPRGGLFSPTRPRTSRPSPTQCRGALSETKVLQLFSLQRVGSAGERGPSSPLRRPSLP
jgi:hypothetical protein